MAKPPQSQNPVSEKKVKRAEKPKVGGQTYVIKAGDTLLAVAARFGTTVEALMKANNTSNPNLISVGQVLAIPTVGSSPAVNSGLTLVPTTDALNMRAKPVVTAPIINVVLKSQSLTALGSPDEIVKKVGNTNQWILVRDPSGTEGYVAAQYVRIKEDGAPPFSVEQQSAQTGGSGSASIGSVASDGNDATIEKNRLNFALNDKTDGPDRLSYENYAEAFAQVLSGQYTQTPLTVGIYASWGMGKSFLLGKIEEKLKKRQNDTLQFAFVKFNAWVYSGSENLWAGMVTSLYNGIEDHYKSEKARHMRSYSRQEALSQIWRTIKKSLSLLLIFGVPALIISYLLDYQQILTSWRELTDTVLLILGGAPLLTKIPDLVKAAKALLDSAGLLRSQELANLSSRKDFRDKIGFMADIQSELRRISDMIIKLDRKSGQKTRFVIVVDDLDRCPPEKAVEVLEGIALLLSDRTEDPFIIFLAMDARVLVKAVEMRYGGILAESGISGYEFLDKIVQIPFRIPPAPDEAIEGYVKSLLYQSPEAEEIAKQRARNEAKGRDEVKPPRASIVEAAKLPEPSFENLARKTEGGLTPVQLPIQPKVGRDAEPKVEEIKEDEPFSNEEQKTFAGFSKFLSRNPRRVKRIVNIYRLARILTTTNISQEVAIKWIILTEQWPFRVACMMQTIEDDWQHEEATLSKHSRLVEIYAKAREVVEAEQSRHLAILDEDKDQFEEFIKLEPFITAEDIKNLHPVTFNLNPAMQNEVSKNA